MDMNTFSSLFSLLSLKAADDSGNGRVAQAIMIVPGALGGGKATAIVTEASNPSCLTLTAYYPLDRAVYLSALSSQGIARFNLSNLNSNRSMAVTGGVDEREGYFYLYAALDMPKEPENRAAVYGELYKMMDTLAGRMGIHYKTS